MSLRILVPGTPKIKSTSSRDRAYQNGFRQGAREQRDILMKVFASYLKDMHGYEAPYGQSLEDVLYFYANNKARK